MAFDQLKDLPPNLQPFRIPRKSHAPETELCTKWEVSTFKRLSIEKIRYYRLRMIALGLYESTYDRSSVQLIKDGYHSIQYFLNCSCLLTLSLRTCKGLLTDKLVENPKLQPCARHHSRNRFDTSLMSNDVKAWHVQKGRNLMIHDAVNAVSVMLMMIQQANMMHDDTTI